MCRPSMTTNTLDPPRTLGCLRLTELVLFITSTSYSDVILTLVLGLGIALQIVLPGRESIVNLIAVTNPSHFVLFADRVGCGGYWGIDGTAGERVYVL